jgi:hypothetical protein
VNLLFARNLPAWVVLVLGLMLSVIASQRVKDDIDRHATQEFADIADELTLHITEKLTAHSLILRGGAALIAASDSVTPAEWRSFAEAMRADVMAPGMHGIAFNPLVTASGLATHEARVRKDGASRATRYIHRPAPDLFADPVHRTTRRRATCGRWVTTPFQSSVRQSRDGTGARHRTAYPFRQATSDPGDRRQRTARGHHVLSGLSPVRRRSTPSHSAAPP